MITTANGCYKYQKEDILEKLQEFSESTLNTLLQVVGTRNMTDEEQVLLHRAADLITIMRAAEVRAPV